MLTSLATQRHAFTEGELVEATAAEAQAWLADGVAELAPNEAPKTPERRRRNRMETRSARK